MTPLELQYGGATIKRLPFADPRGCEMIAFKVVKSGVTLCTLRQVYDLTVATSRWEVAAGSLARTELHYLDDQISACYLKA